MSRIAPSFWRGLIVPSDLISPDTLAANTAGVLGSDYTEPVGVPGAAVPLDPFTEFSPRLSGALSGDLVVTGAAAGFARAPGGVGVGGLGVALRQQHVFQHGQVREHR